MPCHEKGTDGFAFTQHGHRDHAAESEEPSDLPHVLRYCGLLDVGKMDPRARQDRDSRHRGEPPFALGVDGGSRGDLDATGAEGPKSIFKRVEETVEVKESCHVGLAQDQNFQVRSSSRADAPPGS